MTPIRRLRCLPWLLSLMFLSAHAATPADIDRAQREADRLLLEEQQRQRERSQQLEERVRRPQGEVLSIPDMPAPQTKGDCRMIRKIVLDGAALLSEIERAVLVAPFEGRCLGLAEINGLIRAVMTRYVEAGYSTTRAYLPEQDLSQGELRLLVIEGVVEDIRLEGSGVSIGNAFPGLIGKPFNLRDFEQGIDQINRLQSNNAALDVRPGSQPGSSIIVIRNAPKRPVTFGVSLDNTGSEPTGYYQAGVALGVDNLAGVNDYLNLSLRVNPDADANSKLSQSLSAMFGIPFGYWTWSVNASDYQYASTVKGASSEFKSSGLSQVFATRLERVMYRDQNSKWTMSGALSLKTAKNYINDELIAVSSRRLTVADLASNYTLTAGGALWSFDMAYARGLAAFGALTDPAGTTSAMPKAQFEKLTFGLSMQRPLQVGGTDLSWLATFSGQYAEDVLFGSEQFLASGPYAVRGFRKNSLSGDQGWYLRNEIGMPMPLKRLLGDGVPDGSIKPFVGYDYGHVYTHHGSPSGALSGLTLGFNLHVRPASLQFAYSLPVSHPDRFVANDKYVYARLSVDF